MKVLAIDCSAKSVSVAIAENGKLLAEGFLNIKLTHSETLMPIIEQTLSNTRLTLKDIDAFAVTAGPGSFTGIRIGISAIKGMSFADGKPVFAFSTLEAMALSIANSNIFSGVLCGLMDARRNQFYNALFKIEKGEITRLTEDRLIEADLLKNEILEFNIPVILMGDGAELFYSLSGEEKAFSLAPETNRVQRAAGIAIKASTDNNLTPLSPDALQAIYLRKSQAEREREEKLK
ncbi:MAG: tRNA (adenosine(37)-N6)-threonylcarbamoyltransferase complex dimerization subunit type 1 TsaB [Ruminococcaceae bacterium]|nr:tRNA (adenosine(37)-N6)-threonylcarbamoyltransferase complex dimerization subunit type 1 TsaB [Oscillospiraceae bacterium]